MTTDDVQSLIRNSITARERKAEENRATFPYAAELMDQFAEFEPKLIYAEENGRSIGKKPSTTDSLDGDRLVQMHDYFETFKQPRKKR